MSRHPLPVICPSPVVCQFRIKSSVLVTAKILNFSTSVLVRRFKSYAQTYSSSHGSLDSIDWPSRTCPVVKSFVHSQMNLSQRPVMEVGIQRNILSWSWLMLRSWFHPNITSPTLTSWPYSVPIRTLWVFVLPLMRRRDIISSLLPRGKRIFLLDKFCNRLSIFMVSIRKTQSTLILHLIKNWILISV